MEKCVYPRGRRGQSTCPQRLTNAKALWWVGKSKLVSFRDGAHTTEPSGAGGSRHGRNKTEGRQGFIRTLDFHLSTANR